MGLGWLSLLLKALESFSQAVGQGCDLIWGQTGEAVVSA